MSTVYVTVERIQSGTLCVKIKPSLVVLYRDKHNIRIKVCSKAVCGFVFIAIYQCEMSFYRFYLNQLDLAMEGVTPVSMCVVDPVTWHNWSSSTNNAARCHQTNQSLEKIKIEQILANETGDRRQSGAIKTQMSWGVVMRCNSTVHSEPCEPLWS